MPKVTFYGASQEVTGSCFLVKGEKTTVLVDCGLFQGSRFASDKNYEPLPFACGQLDQILVTHAHLDHTGRLPKVCLEGFVGKIYATKPTLKMVNHLWEDALEIMEIDYEERGRLPLYTPEQTEAAIKHFVGLSYNEKVRLSASDYAIFHDAGHILGSAFIELVIDRARMVFSGDVGNVNPPIINETVPLPADVDLLVCESTYGNRVHEPAAERQRALLAMVKETLERGGTLLIPAFAIERTQELLYFLHALIEEGQIPGIPIYLDSPLAIKITGVFKQFPEFYNPGDKLVQEHKGHLFNFPHLRIAQTRNDSKAIKRVDEPKIIIAGSGMMNGGRMVYHLQHYLPDEKNTLFIVGYQAKGTLGRQLLDGADRVRIFKTDVPVKAHTHAIGAFSAHADQKKLLNWMGAAKNLKRVALVHGDDEVMPVFAEAIKSQLKIPVQIPKIGSSIQI